MMGLQMRFVRVSKGFSILYSQIFFMKIANIFLSAYNTIKNRIVADNHININNWLCRNSFH